MGVWYQCEDCIFATNSRKAATLHTAKSGHTNITEEQE